MAVVCHKNSGSAVSGFVPFLKYGHPLSVPVLWGMRRTGIQAVRWYLFGQWTCSPASCPVLDKMAAMSSLPKLYFIESSLDLEVSYPAWAQGDHWAGSPCRARLDHLRWANNFS